MSPRIRKANFLSEFLIIDQKVLLNFKLGGQVLLKTKVSIDMCNILDQCMRS